MNILINTIIFLLMFASLPVANSLNLSWLQKYVMTFSVIIGVAYILFMITKNNLTKVKYEIYIILIGICILIFKFIFNQSDQIQHVIFFLFTPISLSILLKGFKTSQLKSTRYIIYLFFILECSLAIYEKLTLTNTFNFLNEEEAEIFRLSYDDLYFRSSALLGHPLINAVVVSILLSYFLVSELSIRIKFVFLFVGFLAILSFNARGATIIWFFLASYFIIKYLKSLGTKNSKLIFLTIGIIGVTFSIGSVVVEKGFGGRLFTGQLVDGSAMTRMDLLSNFEYTSNEDLLFGDTKNYQKIIQKRQVAGIENSYLVVILNYGIIASIALFISYFLWLKNSFDFFYKWKYWFIIIGFILVGSLNNSLAGYTPWLFFVIVHNAFTPIIHLDSLKLTNNKKYSLV